MLAARSTKSRKGLKAKCPQQPQPSSRSPTNTVQFPSPMTTSTTWSTAKKPAGVWAWQLSSTPSYSSPKSRVRQGPFDLRAANSIGFLAGILLKALDQRLEDRLAHLEVVMLPSKRGTTDTEAFEFRSIKEIKNEQPPTSSKNN